MLGSIPESSVTNLTTDLAAKATTATRVDTFAAPTDVTTNNASSSAHGFMPKADGNAAHFYSGDGTQKVIPASVAGVPGIIPSTDIQVFNVSGGVNTAITWTKPTIGTPQWVEIICIGGGAGGGSGEYRAAGTAAGGGAGGGGGCYSFIKVPASLLGPTVAGQVGAGSAGAAAVTTAGPGTLPVSGGGPTWFGATSTTAICYAGGGNASGTGATGGAGGVAPGAQSRGLFPGGATATGGVGGTQSTQPSSPAGGAGGGGGGGGLAATQVETIGGKGADIPLFLGAYGVDNHGPVHAVGLIGSSPVLSIYASGGGGGGGGSSITSATSGVNNGGAGGNYGGGGGGGGAGSIDNFRRIWRGWRGWKRTFGCHYLFLKMTIDLNQTTISSAPDYSLTDGGVTYQAQKNGYYNPPILKNLAGQKCPSLVLSAPNSPTGINPDGSNTDRFEYIWVSEKASNAPAFNGVERTLSFTFKILDGSKPPSHQGDVIAQFWQGDGGAAKYSPPIYLFLTAPTISNGPWGLHLYIKNDATGKEITNPPISVYSGTVPVDTWMSVSISLRPDYTGNGYVSLSLNGVVVGDYTGNVGYTPQADGGSVGVFTTMRVKTGLYRPNGSPEESIGFNLISYF